MANSDWTRTKRGTIYDLIDEIMHTPMAPDVAYRVKIGMDELEKRIRAIDPVADSLSISQSFYAKWMNPPEEQKRKNAEKITKTLLDSIRNMPKESRLLLTKAFPETQLVLPIRKKDSKPVENETKLFLRTAWRKRLGPPTMHLIDFPITEDEANTLFGIRNGARNPRMFDYLFESCELIELKPDFEPVHGSFKDDGNRIFSVGSPVKLAGSAPYHCGTITVGIDAEGVIDGISWNGQIRVVWKDLGESRKTIHNPGELMLLRQTDKSNSEEKSELEKAREAYVADFEQPFKARRIDLLISVIRAAAREEIASVTANGGRTVHGLCSELDQPDWEKRALKAEGALSSVMDSLEKAGYDSGYQRPSTYIAFIAEKADILNRICDIAEQYKAKPASWNALAGWVKDNADKAALLGDEPISPHFHRSPGATIASGINNLINMLKVYGWDTETQTLCHFLNLAKQGPLSEKNKILFDRMRGSLAAVGWDSIDKGHMTLEEFIGKMHARAKAAEQIRDMATDRGAIVKDYPALVTWASNLVQSHREIEACAKAAARALSGIGEQVAK